MCYCTTGVPITSLYRALCSTASVLFGRQGQPRCVQYSTATCVFFTSLEPAFAGGSEGHLYTGGETLADMKCTWGLQVFCAQ